MIDAMNIIWKLRSDVKGVFPNTKLLILLVVAYSSHFIGQIVVFGGILYYRVVCGSQINVHGDAIQALINPEKLFSNAVQFITQIVLLYSLSEILEY